MQRADERVNLLARMGDITASNPLTAADADGKIVPLLPVAP